MDENIEKYIASLGDQSPVGRSMIAHGRKIQIRLAPVFWDALDAIGSLEKTDVCDLVASIVERVGFSNIERSLVIFATAYYRMIVMSDRKNQ